jgi:hypothetical protein
MTHTKEIPKPTPGLEKLSYFTPLDKPRIGYLHNPEAFTPLKKSSRVKQKLNTHRLKAL